MKKLILIPLLFVSLIVSATNYYVKVGGSDAVNGLTDGTAWETITKVNNSSFLAGDSVFFNKGDVWIGRLNIPSSGNSGASIVFTAYGTGVNPVIDANEANTRCISLNNQSYITIDGIDCRNATNGDIQTSGTENNIIIKNLTVSNPAGSTNSAIFGILLYGGSSTIINCTITSIEQLGVQVAGGNNIVTYNNISYTNKSSTGWGAGIMVGGTGAPADDNTVVAYNTIHDNGGVGLQGSTHGIYAGLGTTNCNIHHNIVTNSVTGYGIKISGSANVFNNFIGSSLFGAVMAGNNSVAGTYTQNIYNNIFTGNRNGILEGSKGTSLTLSIYNNTFYNNNNTTYDAFPSELECDDDVTVLNIKNNILFGTPNKPTYRLVTQTHADINNNCIYQPTGNLLYYNGDYRTWAYFQGLGFDANGINDDPDFVSASDFHLQAGSPAKDAGLNVGLTEDYSGHTIPYNLLPDIGAYEYGKWVLMNAGKVITSGGKVLTITQ